MTKCFEQPTYLVLKHELVRSAAADVRRALVSIFAARVQLQHGHPFASIDVSVTAATSHVSAPTTGRAVVRHYDRQAKPDHDANGSPHRIRAIGLSARGVYNVWGRGVDGNGATVAQAIGFSGHGKGDVDR